jgi:hypothetical protein
MRLRALSSMSRELSSSKKTQKDHDDLMTMMGTWNLQYLELREQNSKMKLGIVLLLLMKTKTCDMIYDHC